MSNEETQTNDAQNWCSPGCCGPSDSNIDMKEVMENCSQMMERCNTDMCSPSTKESEQGSRPTSL